MPIIVYIGLYYMGKGKSLKETENKITIYKNKYNRRSVVHFEIHSVKKKLKFQCGANDLLDFVKY